MMGLWADGWFYISSAGLLVSGILFFFLLGQYRVASEAADVTEGEQGADKEVSTPAAIRPVYIPDEAPVAQIASHPLREPEPKPKLETKADYPGPERRKDPATSTGGISPAVVYLQNIKGELADLHKDLRALAKRVDDELASVSTRDEALIDRLGELTRAVESMKAAAPAPAPDEPVPAPRKARKAEKAPEPEKAAEPAPAEVAIEVLPPPPADAVPEPKVEPAASPDETIRMDLSALVAAPAAEPEAKTPVVSAIEPAPSEPARPQPSTPGAPPEEKPRRGPVWPV
ncbi:MAG: hypothetical protein PHS14_16520 [Elusimicrobia bacterium]|nr:hypothetical protein [Elusimicrobiota bacterium]